MHGQIDPPSGHLDWMGQSKTNKHGSQDQIALFLRTGCLATIFLNLKKYLLLYYWAKFESF